MIGHTDRNLTETPAISGNNPLDKMKNVYDLEGNYGEWTAEAGLTSFRNARGGCYVDVSDSGFLSASSRRNGGPTVTRSIGSARAGLYVNM